MCVKSGSANTASTTNSETEEGKGRTWCQQETDPSSKYLMGPGRPAIAEKCRLTRPGTSSSLRRAKDTFETELNHSLHVLWFGDAHEQADSHSRFEESALARRRVPQVTNDMFRGYQRHGKLCASERSRLQEIHREFAARLASRVSVLPRRRGP